MIKLLLLALVFFLGYSLVQILTGQRRTNRRSTPPNQSPQGEEMVQDPSCGRYIPLSEARRANIQGRQHYFCSKECLQKYRSKNG